MENPSFLHRLSGLLWGLKVVLFEFSVAAKNLAETGERTGTKHPNVKLTNLKG